MDEPSQPGRWRAGRSVAAADVSPARPRPEPVDLSEPLQRALRGDEDGFRALFRAVQPGLVRYLRGLVGNDAEDVASETWAQIARDLGSFSGGANDFRAWAATIGRHRALDHLRYVRRRPVAAMTAEDLPDVHSNDDPAELVQEAASTTAAIALIASLPPDQAEAVLLRVVMGLDVAATARVLGKRPGAVRTATHRGLRRLAERLAEPQPPGAG